MLFESVIIPFVDTTHCIDKPQKLLQSNLKHSLNNHKAPYTSLFRKMPWIKKASIDVLM